VLQTNEVTHFMDEGVEQVDLDAIVVGRDAVNVTVDQDVCISDEACVCVKRECGQRQCTGCSTGVGPPGVNDGDDIGVLSAFIVAGDGCGFTAKYELQWTAWDLVPTICSEQRIGSQRLGIDIFSVERVDVKIHTVTWPEHQFAHFTRVTRTLGGGWATGP